LPRLLWARLSAHAKIQQRIAALLETHAQELLLVGFPPQASDPELGYIVVGERRGDGTSLDLAVQQARWSSRGLPGPRQSV